MWPEADLEAYLTARTAASESTSVQLRPKQLPPAVDWFVWLIKSGRGFGKTRAGGEWFYKRGMEQERKMMLAGRTPSDVRDYSLYGPGGLMTNHPDLRYEPSKRMITWPTGATAYIRSGANPEEFRNFSGDTVWVEEFAAWKYPRESWENLMFGVREADPHICITTTPKPIKILKKIMELPGTVVVTGSTYENRENLSERYIENVIVPVEGTRLGRQEVYGEVLDEVPGALWSRTWLDAGRVRTAPDLYRIVVAIDPAVTATEDSDETGIVVAGIAEDGQGYVLADLGGRYTPSEWGHAAVRAYHLYEASAIVGEVNNGGDLVEHTIRTLRDDDDREIGQDMPFIAVRAAKGKYTRAEPISALYDPGEHGQRPIRVHHAGAFDDLEDQMCTWVPGEKSPDRLDALVWGLTELMISSGGWLLHGGDDGG